MRTLTRPLFISIALLTSWFLVHCLLVTTDGLMDELQPADCLVVLGNTVHSDGSLSPRLKARLDKAFDLYQTGMGPVVL